MDKIIIPFGDKQPEEIDKTIGVVVAIPWDALKETIAEYVRLRPDEQIDGLVINDTDICVKISRKKGRKASKKLDHNKPES